MKSVSRNWASVAPGLALAAAISLAGCSIDKQTAPAVTGPSEFGLAVTMTASPDQLPRDGASQSIVTITARDASGASIAGQRFTVSTSGASAVGLSQTQVTTGSNGSASFAVIAPPATGTGNKIIVNVTPVGSNFSNEVARTVAIGILGASNLTAPTPAFTVLPESPTAGQSVLFDASGTTDEGVACGSLCGYAWDFGDGDTAAGMSASHKFKDAGSYTVSLTVRDDFGLSVTKRQLITVAVPKTSTTP
jgi:PKD repeat protein